MLWQVNEDKCTAQRNMKAIAQGAAREGFVCCLFVCGCDVQLRCLLYPAACLLARYVLNETKIINARSRAKRRTCYYLGKQKQQQHRQTQIKATVRKIAASFYLFASIVIQYDATHQTPNKCAAFAACDVLQAHAAALYVL